MVISAIPRNSHCPSPQRLLLDVVHLGKVNDDKLQEYI